jgi:hypothetical protein
MPPIINMFNAHYVLSWLNKRFDLNRENSQKRPNNFTRQFRKTITTRIKITWTKKLKENLAAKRSTQKRVYLKFRIEFRGLNFFKQKHKSKP